MPNVGEYYPLSFFSGVSSILLSMSLYALEQILALPTHYIKELRRRLGSGGNDDSAAFAWWSKRRLRIQSARAYPALLGHELVGEDKAVFPFPRYVVHRIRYSLAATWAVAFEPFSPQVGTKAIRLAWRGSKECPVDPLSICTTHRMARNVFSRCTAYDLKTKVLCYDLKEIWAFLPVTKIQKSNGIWRIHIGVNK